MHDIHTYMMVNNVTVCHSVKVSYLRIHTYIHTSEELLKCLQSKMYSESSAYFDGDPSAYLKGMIAEGSDGGVKLSGVEYVVTFDAYYSSQRFLNTTRELGFQEVRYDTYIHGGFFCYVAGRYWSR